MPGCNPKKYDGAGAKNRDYVKYAGVFRAHGAHFSETAPLHPFYIKLLILLLIRWVQLWVQFGCSLGAVGVQKTMF
jgi:hypothetical protein